MIRDKKYYVYQHKLQDGTIFYVGKGTGNRAFETRYRNHIWEKVVKEFKKYIVEIKQDNLTSDEAYELEIKTIKEIGLENLTNLSEGGEGQDNSTLSPEKYKEWIKNKSIAQTGVVGYWRGKKRPQQSKVMKEMHKSGKMSYEHLKGPLSEEHKKNISEARKGLTISKKFCKLCERSIASNNFSRHICNKNFDKNEHRREWYHKRKRD